MEQLFSQQINPNIDMEELESMCTEFKNDYNQRHFVRNETFKAAAEKISGALLFTGAAAAASGGGGSHPRCPVSGCSSDLPATAAAFSGRLQYDQMLQEICDANGLRVAKLLCQSAASVLCFAHCCGWYCWTCLVGLPSPAGAL